VANRPDERHKDQSGALKGVDMNNEEVSTACFLCGVCCTKYQVHLTLIETRRIADSSGLAWEEWLERYTIQGWPGSDNFMLRRHNGACVFLEQVEVSTIARCLIQSFKPFACREWNSSLYQRACQEGLAKYWGLTVGPSGQLEGSDGDRRRFLSFLESLTLADDTAPEIKIKS
jgi:Fe-S-cluster containining protein